MFGNFGPWEMIFVFLIVLLVFGAKRLPEIGSSLGKGIREFKRSFNDIQSEINRPELDIRQQIQNPENSVPQNPPPERSTPRAEQPGNGDAA